MSEQHGVESTIDLEIFVTADKEIVVKLSGFESDEDADNYASYLSENLSLLLFESKVMH